jgi:hypothetical protein
VEAKVGIRIPIVWFVRFQRPWSETIGAESAEAAAEPPAEVFDGFALARDQLGALEARGDELGWHYHAYHFVRRQDLAPAERLSILEADLTSCAAELRRRHPDLRVESFRFGWFFVPDYAVYDTLLSLGIRRDASLRADYAGRTVADSACRYLPPLTTVPAASGGLDLFPYSRTKVLHDWTAVRHDLGWHRLGAVGAARARRQIRRDLERIAANLRRRDGAFHTYRTFPQRDLVEVDR